jgi:hypothetical protein
VDKFGNFYIKLHVTLLQAHRQWALYIDLFKPVGSYFVVCLLFYCCAEI